MWQHVKLSVQICPWYTQACCWDAKQATDQQTNLSSPYPPLPTLPICNPTSCSCQTSIFSNRYIRAPAPLSTILPTCNPTSWSRPTPESSKRFAGASPAQCPCGEADQTPEHDLQSCSPHHQARQQIWPTCVSLQTKLWGSAEDLFQTFKYAALMGERI